MNMEGTELQVTFTTQVGQISTDAFGPLKEWIDINTARYEGITVTEDNIAQAKADLADMRKVFNALEDERKNVKRTWAAPYMAWEAQYKEAVDKLSGLIETMGGEVKALEAEQEEKRVNYRKNLLLNDACSFERGFDNLVEDNPALWNRVWKKEYANKSVSENKIQGEWRQALRDVQTDLEMVRTYVESAALMPLFLQTGSVAQAMQKLYESRKAMKTVEPPREPEKAPEVETLTVTLPLHPEEGELKMAQARRAFRGPLYKVRALVEFAEKLGLEVVKIQ